MAVAFDAMAQEMVEATSRLLSGRTVNLMDTRGVILASTEKERIGTLHTGAAEAARTGKPVYITRESVPRYPGAREGCNMPVYNNEHRLIGVVGIYGDPEKVEDAAHLLAVYTVQYFDARAIAHQHRAEDILRDRLMRLLITKGDAEGENTLSLCSALRIHLEMPCRMLLVDLPGAPDALDMAQRFNGLLSRLLGDGLLHGGTDLAAVLDGRLAILKCGLTAGGGRWLEQLLEVCRALLGPQCLLCAGGECAEPGTVYRSYAEALALAGLGETGLCDIAQPGFLCRFFLAESSLRNHDYLDGMLRRLAAAGEEDADMLLKTAESYYRAGGSVTQAAGQLHIHKNTLQYRMHRLYALLALEGCSAFEREYLVRLCIRRYRSGPGRKAYHIGII